MTTSDIITAFLFLPPLRNPTKIKKFIRKLFCGLEVNFLEIPSLYSAMSSFFSSFIKLQIVSKATKPKETRMAKQRCRMAKGPLHTAPPRGIKCPKYPTLYL